MRGLTTDERETLKRWRDRVYLRAEQGDVSNPPFGAVEASLFARGLATWEECGLFNVRAVATASGELALRVDAAARAAGVWT
jgi:hypothetical protein